MTRQTRTPILLALALSVTGPAATLAETPAPVLYCTPGEGCARGEAAISETGAGVLFGQPAVPGQVSLVYIPGQKAAQFVPLSPEAVNQAYGGAGPMPRLVFRPNDSSATGAITVFAPGETGRDMVIDLFPTESGEEEAGGIVPRDGLWRVRSREQTFANCPAQMEAMFRATGQMDTQNETHRFTWNGRFDPEQFNFLNGEGQRITWRQTGPDSYEGDLFDLASGPSQVAAKVGTEIRTPTEIDAWVDLQIGAMMGVAELAALGLADCKVMMTFDILHTAD
ncbi:hypothetical protein [Oceanicola sp. S124]|uniref:hypothetical protein n=1 Tax=Oceanicola sp. S124 TaxID=1042378 RepID=UPI00025584F0|nr:hypothetical protein [Oceanicola sp. S124]